MAAGTWWLSWADTLEAFDQALNVIRAIPGIAHTETSILLSTHKA